MPSSKPSKTRSGEFDAELRRLLTEKDLATSEEIDECLADQQELADKGDPRNLTQILLKRGVVTERQMARLRQTIDDAKGRQIPGYQLLSKIGAGSMATVFKARQLSLNRIVAIKVLPQRLSADSEYVERFYREGEAAAKLNHPNIVQAIDIGEANGYHYFVMEYIEGHTVYDELIGGKVYGEAEALRIAIQIGRALAHAHSQDLIHRDVKPKNIMITTEGEAKLADMGLARAVSDATAAQAEAGLLFGTPYYISPEQIVGREHIDFRADIYSLGATLYHMVTGRVPYQAPDAKSVMMKHLKEKLTSPDRHNIDLSFGICKIIRKMMAKDPRARHASTAEMLRDLESIDFLLEADTPQDNMPPSISLDAIQPEAAPKPAAKKPPPAVSAPRPPVKAAAGPPAAQTRPITPSRTLTWVLAILLAVSVLVNLILLLTRGGE